ncbi:hypothetical protein CHLRE_10g455650v5 [Chlamydomonas reinhardtii]|uniref:Hcy-binding domain-containing protein n=1 Tax=Chlamydomonas reinhardtii TaxID=3055 RepID=A0A2K3DBI0_CHLRE|nr:uncharacterized protein CHLRE_10g455650v5 [Chlamydomonas reinhardtii]PNW77884.1 hypothetical protein CHLRE_10g455650v5 [Chlamydomonas reinhardtii]
MHNPLEPLLAEQGVVILDGAQGTELERRGIDIGGSKLWSAQLLIDDPDTVQAIHLDYLRSGSDVITTFTYQASLPGFAEAGVDAAHAGRLLNLAVDLAEAARAHFMREQEQERGQEQEQGKEQDQGKEPGHQGQGQEQGKEREQGKEQGEEQEQQESGQHGQRLRGAGSSAAGGGSGSGDSRRHAAAGRRRRPLIAYSCGSYGAYLADGSEFQGDYADSVSTDALIEFHRARLDPVRSRHEIDLIAFETVPCLKEAEAIVELLRRERYCKPAWISFSCKDDAHTCHGEDFGAQCVPLLAAAAAEGLVAAAGVNCTPPRHVPALLAAARQQLQQLEVSAAAPPPPSPPADGMRQQQQHLACAPRRLLLLCYPNSGEQWDGAGRCWHSAPDDIAEPGRFAAAAADWVGSRAMAVSLVGGCCRTGPAHIAALRRRLVAPPEDRAAAAAAAPALQ